MKFKVGDKVRIKRSSGVEMLERRFGLTLIGAVGRIDRWDNSEWRVILDDTTLKSCMSDGSFGVQSEELELYVEPAPRFKIGDRVKVVKARKSWKEKHVGDVFIVEAVETGVVWGAVKPYVVTTEDGRACAYVWFDEELAPAPVYVPRHTFAQPTPVDAISPETLDRWVDDGVKNVEAQKTLGYEHPSYTMNSGDTLLRIENGKAYLYRLEGTKDVE